MIVCDIDNIAGLPSSPSRQTIVEELRRQTQALMEFRKQFRTTTVPSASAPDSRQGRSRLVARA
ncbi:MAG: hypothetical protein BWX88_00157 [Planctomycetes bacterium ADurb.Bin126]|nr:MAG: hypothetical protein BWX88_00157 [Planctomycetes bacterium ADurb.Bin126]HOD84812.1 hypothetical protein [Phycisphaerae bacterium]HQL73045.1 hypothetical protein [Phycisphaerae bacterium]